MKFCLLSVLLAPSFHAPAQMEPVLMRSADNQRSGSFQDATLTVANLKAKGIVRITTIPVIRVQVADGSVHDVMILPSMANVV